jgi:hypothetical protein
MKKLLLAGVMVCAASVAHADEDVWLCEGSGDVAVSVDLSKMEATLYPGGFYRGARQSTVKIKRTGPKTYAFEGYAVNYTEGRKSGTSTRTNLTP